MISKKINIASKTKRLLAFIIDYILVQTIYFNYVYFIQKISFKEYLEKDFNYYDTGILLLICFIYGAIIYPLFSGNVGHRIIGLKVYETKEERWFNKFYEGAIREFFKNLCTVLVLPHLWIFFDKKNRGIYDVLFNTIVIKSK